MTNKILEHDNYYQIHHSVLQRKDIDIYEKLIYSIVLSFTNKDRVWFGSNATMADNSSLGQSTVSTKINSLKKKGWIQIDNPKGKYRKIKALVPPLLNDVEVEISSSIMNHQTSIDELPTSIEQVSCSNETGNLLHQDNNKNTYNNINKKNNNKIYNIEIEKSINSYLSNNSINIDSDSIENNLSTNTDICIDNINIDNSIINNNIENNISTSNNPIIDTSNQKNISTDSVIKNNISTDRIKETQIPTKESLEDKDSRPVLIDKDSNLRFSSNSDEIIDYIYEIYEKLNDRPEINKLCKIKFGKDIIMYDNETKSYICFDKFLFNETTKKHDRSRYFIFDNNGIECLNHYYN
jgi:biotin operon repressor